MRRHLLLALLCLAPSTAQAARLSLAVMDLRPRGVDEQAAAALSTEVTNAIAGLKIFSVISGEDVRRLLALEETKQGCTGGGDAACLAEIGGALGVEFLVYGEVAKLGDTYNLSLVLLDTKKATAINRDSKKIGESGKLLEETNRLARSLVQPLLDSRRGHLVLDVREPGAKITVDGQTAGIAPISRLTLAMGPHEVSVEKAGFLTWARTVEVQPEQVSVEAVTLVPNQDFIAAYESSAGTLRTIAWITAGTAAVLLGTAGVVRLVNDARFDDLVSKQYLEVRGVCAEVNPNYNGTDYCPTELGRQNKVVDSVSSIERLDTMSLVFVIGGLTSGIASAVLFLSGDAPGRYAPFAAPSAAVSISPRGVGIAGTF